MGAGVRAARPRRLVAVAAALVAAAVAAGPAASASPALLAAPAVPPVPATVLPATTGALTGPAPVDTALVAQVRAALGTRALGPDVAADVIDVATGTRIVGLAPTRPQKPASTLKLLTAVTVLRALGDDARLSTRVVQGATPRDVVLVGGGDATLTRAPAPSPVAGQAARPASLSALVAATVKALHASGRGSVTVHVDDSLFTGPRTAAGWPSGYVSSGVIGPVSALSVDQGQRSASSRSRDADPALAAGDAFVAGLRAAGITVLGAVTRVRAASGAQQLAEVQSPTVAQLVERMLTESDDTLAEALAHLAGGALGGAASFAGGAAATTATLTSLGVPVAGVHLEDGSGLSLQDVVPPATLVRTLAAIAADAPPAGATAGVLWPASSGLPVAGATGTLALRFGASGTTQGRGVVRAKTGTLTGVDCLAGLVRDPHGRLLAFAYLADRTVGPQLDSRTALDRAAAALAG